MPVLEVVWEEVKLPPLEYGYDGIDLISAEDADTISVYRMIGPANNGEATLYGLWKTTDGGKTWNEIEKVISDQGKVNQLELPPSTLYYLSLEKALKSTSDPLLADPHYHFWARDPNNPNNVLLIAAYVPPDARRFIEDKRAAGFYMETYGLFLSLKDLLYQVSLPPSLIPYDYYPEIPQIPQLTMVRAIPWPVALEIISADDGSIKLFVTMPTVIPTIKEGAVTLEEAVFWKATVNIKSPN